MAEHTSMLSQALNQSELDDTEKRMLLDKANLTDYQATDQELLAQVARFVKMILLFSKSSQGLAGRILQRQLPDKEAEEEREQITQPTQSVNKSSVESTASF
jgi:hypothetical protein